MKLARRKIRVRRLRRSELPIDTVELARFLIGKTLVHDLPHVRLSGRIVETEAYIVGDAASHAFRGLTARNHSLFLERGHAYVYFIYGNHYMLNISGQRGGIGEGVLLRGLEPIEGIEWMQRHRHTKTLTELSRGPGRLAAAMRITRSLDGLDLCATGPLWLGTAARATGKIGVSVRIGISREAHRLLRFYERGNAFVSGPKSLRV
ncbi:MAG TPA: DNA-3-methyladenine glycosylase [Candidatus Acidoferrales bacterium]|nr:DNA-3-methyladenine glycosylase [Candidatus Acidoferrales bacterium]